MDIASAAVVTRRIAVLAIAGLWALGLWIAYRVIRGWLALRDKRPMYT